jgi:hypothetical protein
MGVKGRLVPPRTLTSTETVERSFRIFYRITKDTKLGHYPEAHQLDRYSPKCTPGGFSLTLVHSACKGRFMKHIHAQSTLRFVAAMLSTVAVIVLSSLATHAPPQNQNSLTLKNIRTDKVTTFYADNRTDRAWFVEMVLPTGHYADNRANRAWFVEMVLPTGDGDVMTENLKSVAATL